MSTTESESHELVEPHSTGAIPVVGIGASAGGLDAFRRFFNAMPGDSGMAFVLVQHLDPNHKSLMPELIGKTTAMPVIEISDQMRIEENHVYMIPPNRYLTIEGSVLKLSESPQPRGIRMAIDHFFRSLAEDRKNRAICIVLSGTGSDGTAGLRAVKASGGMAMTQDPKTAEYDGMPTSAIATDSVDFILPVEEMPQALIRYAAHPYLQSEVRAEESSDEAGDEISNDLGALLSIVKSRTDFDLSHYKVSTIERRIQRRMGLQHIDSNADYLKLLREDMQEVNQLLRDMLINVTDFFRDREAFDALEQTVIPKLIDESESRQPIRVWIPGCATGEEAYSIAILLLEQLEQRRLNREIQIFASDVNEEALKLARTGRYPASIAADIKPARLERFFDKQEGDFYQVKKRLRQVVSFALQDLINDPPFSKLDLISCRNLMIYLKTPTQQRLLSVFHFTLKPGRFLFLGSSETIGRLDDMFEPIMNKWRIYRRIGTDQPIKFKFPMTSDSGTGTSDSRSDLMSHARHRHMAIINPAQQMLLETFAPASVVINRRHEIRYLHGNLEDFLELPRGEPVLDLMKMLPDSLRTRVRAAIYKAGRDRNRVTVLSHFGKSPDHLQQVRISVFPTRAEERHESLLLIAFEPVAPQNNDHAAIEETDYDTLSRELEAELQATRDDLRSTVEELEASNEELKSSNEEIMSMNEELQSTNEELETSAEETRSLNEELTTVNSQLKEKLEELEITNNDLANFFASTKLATLFLDTQFCIKRFTPAVTRLFRVRSQDMGRSIDDLAHDELGRELTQQAQNVLDNLSTVEEEIKTSAGEWYIRRILPYRTDDNRIEGVVITFINVTHLKNASEELDARLKQQAVIADLGLKALTKTPLDELFEDAVGQMCARLESDYCKVLQYLPADHEFLLKAGTGWQPGLVGSARISSGINSQAGYTLQSHKPVVVEDLHQETRFHGPQLLIDHHVVSGMSVQIEDLHGAYGVLGVHSTEKRRFSRHDIDFLQSVANVLSSAIQRNAVDVALQAGETRFRKMTDGLPQIVFTLTGSGDVDYANERWHNITGASGTSGNHRLARTEWAEYLHPDDATAFFQKLDNAIAQMTSFETEIRLRHRDKNHRWYLVRCLPLDPTYNHVQHWLLTFNDIDDQKRAQRILSEADRQKDNFLALLAHELRNPLAPVRNAVEVLDQIELDDPTLQQMRDIIRRQTRHMTKLLDDLLDIARITRDRIELNKEKVTLQDIVDTAVESKRASIEEKGHRLDIELPQQPLWIHVDPTRFTQIIANLLDNAVKFTESGGDLRVSADIEEDQVNISVVDSGRGVDSEELEDIFDLFAQTDITLDRAAGGLGLGLALVKRLVSLHGGQVEAFSSGQGQGSEFRIKLPLADTADTTHSTDSAADVRAATHTPYRILIVDDNRDAADALTLLLQLQGHTTHTIYSGTEAVEMATHFAPQVVLLDIGLPQMDGYQVANKLREQFGRHSMALVAVTGYGQAKDIEQAQQAGFDRHLLKPVSLEQIKALLDDIDL